MTGFLKRLLSRKDRAVAAAGGRTKRISRPVVSEGHIREISSQQMNARGEYDETMEMYRKSLTICEELGDKAGMGRCYNNMGIVARNRGRYDEAMELYRKSLATFEQLGDKAGMGSCYTNMARLAKVTGDERGARTYARKAVKMFDNVGIPVSEELRKAAEM